jgi:hypothetical protein
MPPLPLTPTQTAALRTLATLGGYASDSVLNLVCDARTRYHLRTRGLIAAADVTVDVRPNPVAAEVSALTDDGWRAVAELANAGDVDAFRRKLIDRATRATSPRAPRKRAPAAP